MKKSMERVQIVLNEQQCFLLHDIDIGFPLSYLMGKYSFPICVPRTEPSLNSILIVFHSLNKKLV